MDARIRAAKAALGDRLLILGHHYQRDEVIAFADHIGDSLKLAQLAALQQLPTVERDDHGDDQPHRVDQQVPFATHDLFAGIVPADPPVSVVLTDWLSTTPALG